MKQLTIRPGGSDVSFANDRPAVLIAGPCVIESERHALATAGRLREIARRAGVPLVFKASFDKANRSSVSSYRGPGLREGLRILALVKERSGLPVLTDVHCTEQVAEVARVADILQVPAYLCRQTDLIAACARSGKIVNVKKGQFLAPEDMAQVVKKIESAGNRRILLTERGASFGYHNLVVDMRSIEIMKAMGYPVVFDATHSVQLPGGLGHASGGQREFVLPLTRAAAAVGVAGVFLETHPDPAKALSDGPNSLPLGGLQKFLAAVLPIDRLVKARSR